MPTFIDFVTQNLVPMLRAGDIVVMDTLCVHKNAEALAAIEAVRATVKFPPPYSPEFNAIEICWGWLKQDLRRVASRSVTRLIEATLKRWESVTPHLCYQWARGCGYDVDAAGQPD
ncbi:MAG: transposase [Myxococcota bacterium]|jgi:transposase